MRPMFDSQHELVDFALSSSDDEQLHLRDLSVTDTQPAGRMQRPCSRPSRQAHSLRKRTRPAHMDHAEDSDDELQILPRGLR